MGFCWSVSARKLNLGTTHICIHNVLLNIRFMKQVLYTSTRLCNSLPRSIEIDYIYYLDLDRQLWTIPPPK
jgi:hypothetical protein